MKIVKDKNIKWWIGIASCMVLFVIIGVFTYMKMSFLWEGVQIVASIEKVGSSSLARVSGYAKNATFISLNGREIFIDKDGKFSEAISLISGFSVVTIKVEDKFGKSKEWKEQLVFYDERGARDRVTMDTASESKS